MEASGDWCGREVELKMKGGGEVIRGEVFTYDKGTDTLVLKENCVGQQIASYRMLKGSRIDASSVKLSGVAKAPEPLPSVSEATIAR